jgi:hypothetical protein
MNPSLHKKLTFLSNLTKEFFLIIGVSVFLIVAIHYAIGGARIVKHTILGVKTGQAAIDETRKSPVFDGYDLINEYFLESNDPNQELLVLPYYHWKRNEYNGKAINVDKQSLRKTIKNPLPDAKKVFMFGGSALWGTGSPDKYTIASQLQALLGEHYDVYNFGESAFVAAQEFNLLLEQLSKGFIPDIVIFYDGPIDIYTGLYSPGRPRHPQFSAEDYTSKSKTSYLLLKLLEKTNYIAITERVKKWRKQDPISQWETSVLPNIEANAQMTLDQYAHFMKQVKAIGKAYGFEVYHVWQPILLTENKPLTPAEKKVIDETSPALIKSYQVAQQLVKAKLGQNDNFYYIADVFNNFPEPLYFDFCHTGPKGNEIVAQKIYDEIFKS